MPLVIVTMLDPAGAERDLEIDDSLAAWELASLLARSYRWPLGAPGGLIEYAIQAAPPGRVLQSAETLAGAGVCTGAILRAEPVSVSTAHEGPLRGWRPLGIPVPGAAKAGV